MRAGTILEAIFDDARVKRHRARVACGYDPTTPEASDDEENAGMDQIKEDARYEDEYLDDDGDGEEADGDGLGDQADSTAGLGDD